MTNKSGISGEPVSAKPVIDAANNHYRNSLLNIKTLPSIPIVMMEVTNLLGSSRTSASELGRVISRDQGLVAKILTVANSPLYGLPRRVSTIEFAIVILGFDHIKNIVIALSMIDAFKNKDDNNWNRKKYWHHSILTATAAKRIADDLGFAKSGEAFTAGLLHDLGISIIHKYFTKEYDDICTMVRQKEAGFMKAEEQVLGMTHMEIAKYLLERWNLPKSLTDAVFYHHTPSACEDNTVLSAIIHLADYMTLKLHPDNIIWDEDFQLDENIIGILKLGDEDYLQKFIDTYQDSFRNQTESFLL